MPRFGHPENTQLTTATSVTNGLNTLPEYVGSVGKYSCCGQSRGRHQLMRNFWTSALWVLDEAGIRGARGYFAVCPSVPGAVSSAVRRGSKADPAGPAFGKKHQSLVIRVFCVPCRRSCRPRP